MASMIDKTVTSKYQPKSTNVIWVDTSLNPPIEKHFINGKWVAVSGGGGGTNIPIEHIQPTDGMKSNVLYDLGLITSDTTFLFNNSDIDSNTCNHWYWTFNTPNTAPTITWPADILVWNGDEPPTINENKHYEISVLGGVASYIETEIPTNE